MLFCIGFASWGRLFPLQKISLVCRVYRLYGFSNLKPVKILLCSLCVRSQELHQLILQLLFVKKFAVERQWQTLWSQQWKEQWKPSFDQPVYEVSYNLLGDSVLSLNNSLFHIAGCRCLNNFQSLPKLQLHLQMRFLALDNQNSQNGASVPTINIMYSFHGYICLHLI